MPDDLDYERLKLEKDLSDVLKLKRSFNVFFAAEMNRHLFVVRTHNLAQIAPEIVNLNWLDSVNMQFGMCREDYFVVGEKVSKIEIV